MPLSNTFANAARSAISVLLLSSSLVSGAGAQTAPTSTQGWTLTPAGRQVALGDRPLSIASSPDGQTLLVGNDGQSTQSLMVIDRQTGSVRQTIPYPAPAALFLGIVFSPDGKRVFASAGGKTRSARMTWATNS